ncbi:MAG TPA: hypothetical protein VKQ72_13355, partial [Aggregatilineales bacterium]|nr:hypothetical protein [Aggregatilineales bacterium]
AGQDIDAAEVSPENETAAALVRSLHQMARTASMPSAAYRTRLTQRLQEEWNTQGYSSRRKSGVLSMFPVRRLASIAAILVVALVGIIFVIAYQNGNVSTSATAHGPLGDTTSLIIAGMAIALGIVGLVIYIRRR